MSEDQNKLTREDLLKMLAEQINAIDRLPSHAKFSFITNADMGYVLSIIYGLFSSDESNDS